MEATSMRHFDQSKNSGWYTGPSDSDVDAVVHQMIAKHHTSDLPIGELYARTAFSLAVEAMNENDMIIFGSNASFAPLLYSRLLQDDVHPKEWSTGKAFWTIAALAQDLRRRQGEPHPFNRPQIPCPSAEDFDLGKYRLDARSSFSHLAKYSHVEMPSYHSMWLPANHCLSRRSTPWRRCCKESLG